MDSTNGKGAEVPTDVVEKKKALFPIAGSEFGSKGQKIQLLTNHFPVNVSNLQGHFFQYNVALFYDDGQSVEQKGIGRRVLDKLHETNQAELGDKHFAYDGEKTLFTYGALLNKLCFTVDLAERLFARTGNPSDTGNDTPSGSDRKRLHTSNRTKVFTVNFSFVRTIYFQSLSSAMSGQESENSQEAITILNIILRQHAARQGLVRVGQSFFRNDPTNCAPRGHLMGCRGFHSSFRKTQGGLSLNMDVTTTMIIKPGPVIDFIMSNQGVNDPSKIVWSKVKRTIKNLRIINTLTERQYMITGISEKSCKDQTFEYKERDKTNENGEFKTTQITVYNYFCTKRGKNLFYSGDMPCVNVGKPKRPTYIPLEHCSLIPLQRYTEALNTFQRSAFVELSQKPQERMDRLSTALKASNYDTEPMLRSCGISIGSSFTQVDGRVLPAPKLKMGCGDEFSPLNGRWNFNNNKFYEPKEITEWAVVNFSATYNIWELIYDLRRIGESKGMKIKEPNVVIELGNQYDDQNALKRVETMYSTLQRRASCAPTIVLCLLPGRNCDIYGPWKKKCLTNGILTQCMAPIRQPDDRYLTNLLMKINAKLGGMNSILSVERTTPSPSSEPTIILGMDVSHGSPGQSDVPSIAAVVGSGQWPLISKYKACVRRQSSKAEMIESLFEKNGNEDHGIIRELLSHFYLSSGQIKPNHIIILRDGVSESQFEKVLDIELREVMDACKGMSDENWKPKFLLIVAQKKHHTKFFQTGSPDNVLPGTIIDNNICQPGYHNFYLCAHAGKIGTTRPTHYHVLYNDTGLSADAIQEFVHSLSYVDQRSTTATSVVAPIRYAHSAAAQLGTFLTCEDLLDTSSSEGEGEVTVPPLPRLHRDVSNSMFFC